MQITPSKRLGSPRDEPPYCAFDEEWSVLKPFTYKQQICTLQAVCVCMSVHKRV